MSKFIITAYIEIEADSKASAWNEFYNMIDTDGIYEYCSIEEKDKEDL